jgi:cytochrome c
MLPRGSTLPRPDLSTMLADSASIRYHSRVSKLPGIVMKTTLTLLAVATLAASGTALADAGEDLLKKSGCTACHAVDKRVIGPGYQEVAAKYKGDAGAAAKLQDKVKKGGSGVWGQVPMPPNTQVSDADVKTLVAYILALKK